MKRRVIPITGTSPGSASTAIVGGVAAGLEGYDEVRIDADLVGATGGTLDVYLQRLVAAAAEVTGGVWVDWLHFPQLAAGAAAIRYSVSSGAGVVISAVGLGTDASAGTPVLAANTSIGGHPGSAVRCVCVAGASTTVGAAIKVYVTCIRKVH